MFADEPWLDLPPNIDGQARLLARLVSIQPTDFERALGLLRPAGEAATALEPGTLRDAPPAMEHLRAPPEGPVDTGPAVARKPLDPKSFLLDVMGDVGAPLALRIEAAKALLPYTEQERPQ
jgi:hypothetical protein